MDDGSSSNINTQHRSMRYCMQRESLVSSLDTTI